jgi:hypothetical protein
MSLRSALRWTLPPLALIALAGWLAAPRIAQGPAEATEVPQGAGTFPVRDPAAQAPSATGPDRLAAVQKFVAQKNEESGRQQEEFVHAGWTMVKVPPPDAKLLSLDPSLLQGREADLRQQISSSSATPDQAANLARIAREAQDESTQVAAVDALGHIHGEEGQDQLIDLLHTLPDGTMARREVAPLLHPRDLSDPRAAKLAQLLDARDLNAVERKQIAFTLSLIGLRDRSALPASVLDGLSQEARTLLASTTTLAQLSH